MSPSLFRVRELRTHFPIKTPWPASRSASLGTRLYRSLTRRSATVKAVDGVSFDIAQGETLGLVGESGCGKSTLGRTLLRLVALTSGTLEFDGRNITTLSERELRPLRRNMQMIFQDPAASLNPRMRIGDIIAEPLKIFAPEHSSAERGDLVLELLEKVGLPAVAMARYSHELSGGQRQRVGIARALAMRPKFILCDEAVSALDVSVQAQIINLLEDLQVSENLTYLFISHDLQVVRHISDRVAVMYLGKIVEISTVERLFEAPQHPYTRALLAALPVPNPDVRAKPLVLRGDVPSPIDLPTGCAFHPRCPMPNKPLSCFQQTPKLRKLDTKHFAACHLSDSLCCASESLEEE